jgi:release factor glutamine methyltransferase
MIYQPAEDSYFFIDFLQEFLDNFKVKNFKYLDMGSGSGILSETVLKFTSKENIFAVDINPESVELLKEKGINAIKSDLFNDVKCKFDLITFNAPYLPLDEREPNDSRVATTGGKKGDEISVKFLKEAKKYLNKNGKIFLLISSLTPMERIEKFGGKIATRKKIDFEELRILEFTK